MILPFTTSRFARKGRLAQVLARVGQPPPAGAMPHEEYRLTGQVALPPGPAPRLRAVGDIDPRPVDWLWPGRLALGHLAVLEGDPGLGKSFVALDLCARLSTGRPWPDGAAPLAPATSVVLNGEDGAV